MINDFETDLDLSYTSISNMKQPDILIEGRFNCIDKK